MSSPFAASASASPDMPAGVDADIVAAVHRAVVCAENSALSRTDLKHFATLIGSIDHMDRLCRPDMKACFDHPDRPGSKMLLRRQEAWEAIGLYLCAVLGLAGMQIKVRALDYAGHYAVMLEPKDLEDGLRAVVRVAQKHGVFVAREVERMYADKQRGGMMFGTYRNDAPAANDASAADEAVASAQDADAVAVADLDQVLAPVADQGHPTQDEAALPDALFVGASHAVRVIPEQVLEHPASEAPAPSCDAADLPAAPVAATVEEDAAPAPIVCVKTRVARTRPVTMRTLMLDVDPVQVQAFLELAGTARRSVSAHPVVSGEANQPDSSPGLPTWAPARQMSRHRDGGTVPTPATVAQQANRAGKSPGAGTLKPSQ